MLEKLHTEFKDLLAWHPTAIVSVVETKATPVKPWGLELKFVEPSSGGAWVANSPLFVLFLMFFIIL